jgi:hypothetical protein
MAILAKNWNLRRRMEYKKDYSACQYKKKQLCGATNYD